jgi:uncharacterized protein YggE
MRPQRSGLSSIPADLRNFIGKEIKMKKSISISFSVIFLLLVTFAGVGCAQEKNEAAFHVSIQDSVPNIMIQGNGKVTTNPDEAVISFGVISDGKLLKSAYKSNTEKMNLVIKAIKGMGIKSDDIQTSSYSISPTYPKDERGRQLPGKPVAFRVSQQLTIKIRDIDTVGVVIDQVVANGTNSFNGINFTSSKLEELQKEAKQKAVQDAREKAQLMADSLGVKIGRLLKVNDSISSAYPARNMMAFSAKMESAPNIQAGSLEVTGSCTVFYEIIQ